MINYRAARLETTDVYGVSNPAIPAGYHPTAGVFSFRPPKKDEEFLEDDRTVGKAIKDHRLPRIVLKKVPQFSDSELLQFLIDTYGYTRDNLALNLEAKRNAAIPL